MAKKKVAAQKQNPAGDAPKKVMKKKVGLEKKRKNPKLSKEQLVAVSSHAMKSLMYEQLKAHHHGRLAVGGEHMKAVLGIPMPFAFEWLLDCSHYPLGYVTTLVGRYGCNKTSLKWEIGRWFLNPGGQMTDIENESKPSGLGQYIIGYGEDTKYRWNTLFSTSVEDWQTLTQEWYDKQRTTQDPTKKLKNKFYPGRTYPYLIAVDSLMGKLSQESQAKIEEQGYADRGTSAHGYEANIITQFLRKIPQDIVDWPFSFLIINQLKEGPEKPGMFVKERKKAGGAQVDFQECFEIELANGGTSKPTINKFSEGGFELACKTIKMKTWKNSLGQDRRDIKVDILFWHEKDPSGTGSRFHARWDWHSAAVDILLSFSAERKQMVDEVCHIIKQSGDKYHCAQLGVSKSDPVSKHQMGKLLSENMEVRQALRDRLGIKPIRPFEVGECYKEQMDDQADTFLAQMEEELKRDPLEGVK